MIPIKDWFPHALGLGSMMFGWRTDFREATKILAISRANGIKFVDTSVSYARGDCHAIIRRGIKLLSAQSDFILATKVGGISSNSDPPALRGYSYLNIKRQCELALSQLGVDTIDLLQLHHPTCRWPASEIARALDDLRCEGKIKHYGACNFSHLQLECLEKELTYDNISNQVEVNLLNACNLGVLGMTDSSQSTRPVIGWGPLASGLLTSAVVRSRKIAQQSRIGSSRPTVKKVLTNRLRSKYVIFDELLNLEKATGYTSQCISILWALCQTPVNGILVGPSSVDQYNDLLSILPMRADAALMSKIERTFI